MASAHLSRTSGSPTNALKFTYSFWVKLSALENDTFLLDFNTDGNNRSNIGFETASKQFIVYEKLSGSTHQIVATSRVFRDPSAWLHIVASCDKTLATASDRTKIYVNGVRETSLSQTTYPAQNTTGIINTAVSTLIGKYSQGSLYLDGSLTHVHFVDGTAYDASTFGETDSTSGIWKPKTAPSVTYGTNGFFLKMENSGAMGTDSSGNTNTFTVSGNLTQNVDTPSNNFATWNPLSTSTGYSGQNLPINGNTTFVSAETGTNYPTYYSTLGVSSGKYYFECKMGSSGGSGAMIGISDQKQLTGFYGGGTYDYGYFGYDGKKYSNGSGTSYANTFGNNDIVGVAVDIDNLKLYFSKNGVWQNSGNPESGSTGTGSAYTIASPSLTTTGFYFFTAGDAGNSDAPTVNANFGQGYFGTTAVATNSGAGYQDSDGNGKMNYSVPSGYKILCTKGINSF
jgi:hypothetical protein